MMSTPEVVLLEGLRVLELSTRPAGAYCGRVLADMGAQVTRVALPFTADAGAEVRPLLERSLHAAKTLMTYDEVVASGLAQRVDLIVADALHQDAFDGRATALTRSLVDARGASTLVTDLNDFGSEPPAGEWPSTPLIVSGWSAASWSLGEPGREPLSLPHDLPDYLAAVEAAGASVAALLLRDQGAHTGEATEIAAADVLAYYVGMMVSNYLPYGRPWHRDGARASQSAGFYPAAIFPCLDGAIALTCRQPREWIALLEAMGGPEWARDERFQDARVVARDHADEADVHLIAWTSARTVEEVFALAQEHGFPASPVRTVSEALTDPQFAHREFFEPLGPGAEGVVHPGVPYKLHASGATDGRRGPTGAGTPGAPLAGLRVLDFTWVWSGPTVTAGLADLGAEVIRVEHVERLDPARLRGRGTREGRPVEGPETEVAPYFNQLNRGKGSIAVDIGTPEGAELVRRLAAECDVVVESMRPKVLDRKGLSFASWGAANPRLVMLSMSVLGREGPLSDIKGYAMVMAGLSGADALVAYEPERPMGLFNMALGDVNAAGHALAVLLGAILRQRRTGMGCHIDLSQTECMVAILRAALLEEQLTARPRPPANGHSVYAPHGHFRCRGDDAWIAVAARTARERARLGHALGMTDRFADDATLHAELCRWAAERELDEAVALLRDAGVPSGPVQSWEALADGSWARGRPMQVVVTHPLLGEQDVVYLPWSVSGVRARPRMGAPLLGQSTERILTGLLGMATDEIRELGPRAGLSLPAAAPQRA
jgi:crotonobetainyl-CoA:carnitine CoA-transferase CaiB-like acyl-CoA transferase